MSPTTQDFAFNVTDADAAAAAASFVAPVPKLPRLYCIGHVEKVLDVVDPALKGNPNGFSFFHVQIDGDFTSKSEKARILYRPEWFLPTTNITQLMADAQAAMEALHKDDPERKPYSATWHVLNNNIVGADRYSALEAVTGRYYGHFLAGIRTIDIYDYAAAKRYVSSFFSTLKPIYCGYKLKQSERDGELTKYYEVDGYWRAQVQDRTTGELHWNERAIKAQFKQQQDNPDLYRISYDVDLLP